MDPSDRLRLALSVSRRFALMNPGIPFYLDEPTLGGVEEAVSELQAQIELLHEELELYRKPINPSWYEHFNEETNKAGPGSGSGRTRQVQSLLDDIEVLRSQLRRVERARGQLAPPSKARRA